jgi:hypothetical protein
VTGAKHRCARPVSRAYRPEAGPSRALQQPCGPLRRHDRPGEDHRPRLTRRSSARAEVMITNWVPRHPRGANDDGARSALGSIEHHGRLKPRTASGRSRQTASSPEKALAEPGWGILDTGPFPLSRGSGSRGGPKSLVSEVAPPPLVRNPDSPPPVDPVRQGGCCSCLHLTRLCSGGRSHQAAVPSLPTPAMAAATPAAAVGYWAGSSPTGHRTVQTRLIWRVAAVTL